MKFNPDGTPIVEVVEEVSEKKVEIKRKGRPKGSKNKNPVSTINSRTKYSQTEQVDDLSGLDENSLSHLAFVKDMFGPTGKKKFKYYVDQYIGHLDAYVLDKASDRNDLHLSIMELINQIDLYEKKMKDPDLDISKPYSESVARYNSLKKNLATSRVDRIKMGKEESDYNFATMIKDFRAERRKELMERNEGFLKDELAESDKKAKRDKNLIVESGVDKKIAKKAK